MGCTTSRPETSIYNLLDRISKRIRDSRVSDELLEKEIKAMYLEIINIVKSQQKTLYNVQLELERFLLTVKANRPKLSQRLVKDSEAIANFLQMYNYGTLNSSAHETKKKRNSGQTTVSEFDSSPAKTVKKVLLDDENTIASVSTSAKRRNSGSTKTRRNTPPAQQREHRESCVTVEMRYSGSTDRDDEYPGLRLKRMFYAHQSTESQETIGDFGFFDENFH